MEYQSYCDKLQEQFLKSEYISIAHSSYKMLFAPKKSINGMRVFCFIVNGNKASEKLCRDLAKYAMSTAFYDDCSNQLKTAVLPIFIGEHLSDSTISFINSRAFKENGAYILPTAFDLSQQNLLCCESFPLLGSSQFKQLLQFAKKTLNP